MNERQKHINNLHIAAGRATMQGHRWRADALIEAADYLKRTCNWTYSDDEYDHWHTECGGDFVFTEGGPSDNDMVFCCYCGSVIAEILEPPE